jgi:hypothetical protein
MKSRIIDRRKEGNRAKKGERRRYPRVRLEFDGFYESRDRMGILSGSNLNLRGVFLRTAVPDISGSEAMVRLDIPGNVTLVKAMAWVVHSNEDPAVGPVGMGLRFVGLLPWQLKRVGALLLRSAGLESFLSVNNHGPLGQGGWS